MLLIIVETLLETAETVVETVIETVEQIYIETVRAVVRGSKLEPLNRDITVSKRFCNSFYNGF